jgi:hypothetical protein
MAVTLTEREQELCWHLLCAELARRESHIVTMRRAGYEPKLGEATMIASLRELIRRVAPQGTRSV